LGVPVEHRIADDDDRLDGARWYDRKCNDDD